MYNETIKTKFLDTQTNKENIVSIFKSLAEEEEFRGKDLSEFTERDIIEVLKGMNSSSAFSLKVKVSILRTYTSWCITQKYIPTVMNAYDSIGMETLQQCINNNIKKYTTKEELNQICDSLLNARDKFLLLAVFEGLKGRSCAELATLKKADISEKVFQLENREFVPSLKLYYYAIEAANSDSYVDAKGREWKLYDCDLVFKPRANCRSISKEKMQVIVAKHFMVLQDITGIRKLKANDILISGLTYYFDKMIREKGFSIDEGFKSDEYQLLLEKYGLSSDYAIKKKIVDFLHE